MNKSPAGWASSRLKCPPATSIVWSVRLFDYIHINDCLFTVTYGTTSCTKMKRNYKYDRVLADRCPTRIGWCFAAPGDRFCAGIRQSLRLGWRKVACRSQPTRTRAKALDNRMQLMRWLSTAQQRLMNTRADWRRCSSDRGKYSRCDEWFHCSPRQRACLASTPVHNWPCSAGTRR